MVMCETCNNLIIMDGLISERKITSKLMNLLKLSRMQAHRLLMDTKEIYGTRTTKQKDFERNWQIERVKEYIEQLNKIALVNNVTNPKAATAAYEAAIKGELLIEKLMAYDREEDVRITPDMLTPPDIIFTPNPKALGRTLPELQQTLNEVRLFSTDKKINVELFDTIDYDETENQ